MYSENVPCEKKKSMKIRQEIFNVKINERKIVTLTTTLTKQRVKLIQLNK